jgi:predicted transcriptional regulator
MDNETDAETSITVRVPRSLVARLKDAARRDERTLSSLVRKALLELSPEPQPAKRRRA